MSKLLNQAMKTHWPLGLLIGGIVGYIANAVLGFVCGLGLGLYIDQMNAGSRPAESALMLAFLFPTALIGTYGPLAGAIVGLITSFQKSRRVNTLEALIVGLGHGSLVFVMTASMDLRVWINYTLLAVISTLVVSLVTRRVLAHVR